MIYKGRHAVVFLSFQYFLQSNSNGGERGIRTHGPRKGTTVFKTVAFSHSAISPHSGASVDDVY